MVSKRGAINKYVVEENQDKAAEEGLKDIVHESLEGRWGVGKPKGHHEKLVMALISAEGSLGDVLLPHPDLMISGSEVQFRKNYCPMELIQQLIDDGYGVFVFDCFLVKSSIIDT
jgi:hypothetical protein